MKTPLLVFAALLLAGCVGTSVEKPAGSLITMVKAGTGERPEIPRQALIGTWYGKQPTEEGTIKEWITKRSPDGEFRVHFRNSRNGQAFEESTEVGEWGLSFDYEIVVTRGWLRDGRFFPASPDSYFWDLYQIEHLDQNSLKYRHHGSSNRYEVRRVADDFEFPKLTTGDSL